MMTSVKSHVTVQARPHFGLEMEALLDRFAERFGRDRRRLNRLLDGGAEPNEVKKLFIREGLTARHFNSIAFVVKGERASRAACLEREVQDKKRATAAIEKRLKAPRGKKGYTPFEAHQKKRRMAGLKEAVARLERKAPRMIFGGVKLWNAQHQLAENGYQSHEDWKAAWRNARSCEFFLVGSKDESFGNQSCQWNPATKELAIRLPDAIGGRTVVSGVEFPHDGDLLEKAILSGKAVSYLFVKKPKGWYVFATTERAEVKIVTDISRGTLGVDVGPSLVAVAETDAAGNLVGRRTFPLHLYRKSKRQAKARIEEVAVEIGDWAARSGKPLVIEDLDFSVKKAELRERGKGYARMLSGFAYQAVHLALKSRAAKSGIQVFTVNPAYSSVIGVVKFSAMYGLSADESAALAIARRGMNLRETVPAGTALRRPEDRRKHVWSLWNRLGKAQRPGWRHAFITARRGPGGGPRVYPAFPARAAPA